MLNNCCISILTQSAPSFVNGNPVAPTETESDLYECNAKQNTNRYVNDEGGRQVIYRYSVTLDRSSLDISSIDPETIKYVNLYAIDKSLIGRFEVMPNTKLSMFNYLVLILI